MKTKIYPLIVAAWLMAFSCENNETPEPGCYNEDPLEELDWLKDMKQIFEMRMSPAGWQIIQYTYQDEYVFYIDDCFHCPDGLIEVYNCDGDVICEFGGIDGRNTCPDFYTEATDSTMLADGVQH